MISESPSEDSGWIADQQEDIQNRGEPGAVPGEIRLEKGDVPVDVQIIQYDAAQIEEVQINNLRDVQKFASMPSMTWVIVTRL